MPLSKIYSNQTQYRYYMKWNLRLIFHVESNNANCSHPGLQKRCEKSCSRELESERSLTMEPVAVYGLSLMWIWGSTASQKPFAWEPIAHTNTLFPQCFLFFPRAQMCKLIFLNAHKKQASTITFSQLLHSSLRKLSTSRRQTSAGNSNFM